MKYVINDEICRKHGLSLEEFLFLLYLFARESTDDVFTIKKLIREGYLDKDSHVTEEGAQFCKDILLESDSSIPKPEDIDGLVKSLQELFPKGKKDGTNLYWRGNHKEIKTRLQVFFKVFGNKYSFEDILDATKRYVEYHNGNYSYMRILKYFIMKNTVLKSEEKGYMETISDLATFIENKGDESSFKTDFDVTLV